MVTQMADPIYPETLAEKLYAPFTVKAFANPEIVWLSHRYWIGEGVEIRDAEGRRALAADLLDKYAFAVPEPRDPETLFQDITRVFFADRYGAASGAKHGGAGRAGDVDGFNVKGIGRTPLTDPEASWEHAHGCMWLEEAIRDAIYSELAWEECPQKGSQIVAIIDTGTRATRPDGSLGDRRAIVLRTSGLRFAHLERSILFGQGGEAQTEQYRDTARVEAVFAYLREQARQSRQSLSSLLQNAFDAVATQIGYARCWRISHDFYSSNLLLNGGFTDFGAFSFLPNWHHVRRETDGNPHQHDCDAFIGSLRTILFYAHKYLPQEPVLDATNQVARFERRIHAAFEHEIEKLCAPLWDHHAHLIGMIQNILAEHYHQAQRLTDDYTLGAEAQLSGQWVASPRLAGQDWLYGGLLGQKVKDKKDHGQRTGARLYQILHESLGKGGATHDANLCVCYQNLLRWARPREAGTRHAIHNKIYRWSRNPDMAPKGLHLRHLVDQYITHTLGQIRRDEVS
jgi:hypothetical protein